MSKKISKRREVIILFPPSKLININAGILITQRFHRDIHRVWRGESVKGVKFYKKEMNTADPLELTENTMMNVVIAIYLHTRQKSMLNRFDLK